MAEENESNNGQQQTAEPPDWYKNPPSWMQNQPQSAGAGNSGSGTPADNSALLQAIAAMPEKIVNSIREATQQQQQQSPPAEQQQQQSPPAEQQRQEQAPGSNKGKTFGERWFGI